MAKRIVDEEMRFTVIINGNAAQKELYNLEKSTKKLTQENKDLRKQRSLLSAQGKKHSAEYKSLSSTIKQNSENLQINKAKMQALQKQIGVTGLSIGQLINRSRVLRLQLSKMIPGSAIYKKLQLDLKAVNTRLTQLRNGAKATESSLSRMANGFNKYQTLAFSFIAVLTGVVLSGQKLIDFNGKLSDSQSNVQKTTGLTKKEVNSLTKSFGLFKTRTARIELLKLAEDAGRLGIKGTKNIRSFVKEANKIKVALGDDLNEKQIKSVGKMVDVYSVATATGKDYAGALDALGSAINEVSASGSNEASFLVDYMARLGGVSKQAKVSAADNIGYAATFNELELQVETSATAMNKIWSDMFKNTKFYAEIAGVGVKDFSTLLETDANAAMIKFLKGLNNGNGGFGVMLKKMQELDAGGSRGETALLSLAASTEKLEARQKTANQALIEATSLTNEYNIKNNNLAGSLEKLQKWIIGVFTSTTVVEWLSSGVEWFAKFIGASDDADGSVARFKENLIGYIKLLAIVTASILSYKAGVQLTVLWTNRAATATKVFAAVQKVHLFFTNGLKAAVLLLQAGYFRLTGNITRATAAMRVFNTVTKANPLGIVLAVVTALVTAYFLLRDSTKAATTAQLAHNKAAVKANEITRDTTTNLRTLQKIAEDETQSQEARLKAIKEINKIIPDYNKDLDLTAEGLDRGKKAIDRYVDALLQQAQAQALLDLINQKSKELQIAKTADAKSYVQWYEELAESFEKVVFLGMTINDTEQIGNERKKEKIALLKQEKQAAEDALRVFYAPKQGPSPDYETPEVRPPFTDGFVPNPEASPTPNPEANKPDRNTTGTSPRLYNLLKEREEVARLMRENARLRAGLIKDDFNRELALLDQQHATRIKELEYQQAKIANQAEDLYKKATAARKNGDIKTAENYEEQGKILIEKHIALNEQLHTLEFTHQHKLGEILAKGITNKFEQLQADFEREQTLRETDQQNQLASLKNNDQARKNLQKQFDEQDLIQKSKHLKDLVAEANKILTSAEFQGIKIDLLPEAEKQALIDRLKELGLSLAEIENLLASIKNGGSIDGAGVEGLGDGESTDIFGMTISQWELAFANMDELESKLQMLTASVGGLQEIWGAYYEYVNAKEQREYRAFDKNNTAKQQKLKNRLDAGLINERQYEQGLQSLQREADRKKAELEYNAAMRKWRMDLVNAIVGTSMATINGFNTTPFFPLGIAMGALAGILGTIQIGTIAQNKPVRGFESGFIGDLFGVTRQQDGKKFNAAYGGESKSGFVNKPTVFLAGEQGQNFPELIVSGPDLKQINPKVVDSLKSELYRVKGYETGFTGASLTNQNEDLQLSGTLDQEVIGALINNISENTALLIDLKQNGLRAYQVRSLEEAAKTQEDLDKLRTFKSKAQITS